MKETFIIRTEWFDSIKELSDSEQANILKNLFEFHIGNEQNITFSSKSVKLVWSLIAPNLRRNIDAYDKRSQTSALNGVLGGRPVKKNNLNNLNEKPNKPIETLSVSVSDTVSVSVSDTAKENIITSFETFWNLYDNKTDRKKCFDKWCKLKPAEIEKILSTVKEFKAYKPFDKYIHPNPLTYLNGARWNDELPKIVEATKRPLPEGMSQAEYDYLTSTSY